MEWIADSGWERMVIDENNKMGLIDECGGWIKWVGAQKGTDVYRILLG